MQFIEQRGPVIAYESRGAGPIAIFAHEFAGDMREWQEIVDILSASFRCVTYNARGYPPSSVPRDPEAYTAAANEDDLGRVMDAVGGDRPGIVGMSMGAFTALDFALAQPNRVRALVLVGWGSGIWPQTAAEIRQRLEQLQLRLTEGAEAALPAAKAMLGPLLAQKSATAETEFLERFAELDGSALAMIMEQVQLKRPMIDHWLVRAENLKIPVLLIVGDRDSACLEPTLELWRHLPAAQLAVLPNTGHLTTLEEPRNFSQLVSRFLSEAVAT